MTNKDKLEYWKKHDPIHYSEMTSDPTGCNSDSDGFLFEVLIVIFIIGLVIFLSI